MRRQYGPFEALKKMWALRTISYFVAFWVACLLALINPIWGVVNYMMVYQIHPKETWWGAPLTDMGMRFSLAAVAFTMVGFITARKRIPKVRPIVSLWECGVVALLVLSVFALLVGAGYNRTSQYAFEKFWKMLLFVLILGRLAANRNNLRMIIWTFVAGSLYIGYDAFTAPPRRFWLGRLEVIGGPDFSTTSGTAAHMSAMLPIIGLAFMIARSWKGRVFAAITGALTVNTIIMCRTRSAFIGLGCGVLAALLMAPRARRFRIRALIVVCGVLALSMTDDYFWDRMRTLTERSTLTTDAATVSRTEIWKISLAMLADHPLGLGPGNFTRVVGDYDQKYYKRSAHNTLVVCFTELGFAGGFLFLLLVAAAPWYLHSASKMAKLSDDPVETKIFTYGLLVALVTYFITGLGTERFYCESFWWILALPLGLYRMVVSEARARASVPALAQAADDVETDDQHVYTGQLLSEP